MTGVQTCALPIYGIIVIGYVPGASTNIKTVNGLLKASMKTNISLAAASLKTINGLS